MKDDFELELDEEEEDLETMWGSELKKVLKKLVGVC